MLPEVDNIHVHLTTMYGCGDGGASATDRPRVEKDTSSALQIHRATRTRGASLVGDSRLHLH